jgi:signal transduction histidine kinase
MADTKQILVVAGDYNVIHQTRQAVRLHDFAIQTAYSHRDGLYALSNGEFDAVLVDAAMVSRASGEITVKALAAVKPNTPVFALIAKNHVPVDSFPPNVVSTLSTESNILQNLLTALHLPMPNFGLSPILPPEAVEADENTRQWAEEIDALFSLSKSLTEVLDLGEVLNRVVEAARRLTNAEEGMILLPDEAGGELFLRAKVGIDVEVARNFRVKTEDTLAGRVFAIGEPVLIGAKGPLKVKTEYLVNSLLYVPIIYEGKCIGVLGVNNRSSEALFLPRHQDLLQNLAAFAAIAIENARIHEETLDRTRELQTLVETSQTLNSSLSLEYTLPNICEQLMRIVQVNLAEIYEWDSETRQLRTMARSFRTVWPSGQGPIFDLVQRPSLQLALTENSCLVVTRNDAPGSEADYIRRVGADTVQIIPIFGGNQPLAVVLLFYIHPPEKLPALETLQRVQHMSLEILVTLSNQTGSNRPQSVFRSIEDVNRMTGADWCEIDLLRPDQKTLSVNLSVGKGVWLTPPQPFLDLSRHDDIVEAVESQAPIIKQMDSKTVMPGARALFDVVHSRSILGLPLVQRGQAHGMVLFADWRRGRVFTERDIDMGRAIVGQAATALENARLVHHLERSLADLKDAQGRLVQTARLSAMGELAAAVAHQINNPLTTIMVDSEMMLMDERPESKNYRSLHSINRAGKRAAGVAHRLLAIARPNDPESPPERIDVVDTIQGVLSLVKSHIERDHIHLLSDLPGDLLPPVWAVPGQLDDIWLNLLMNAHDALIGREGAEVGIRAVFLPAVGRIDVTVWDNGPGIPADILDEVFKPFFTTKPVGEGTGLGLHICRQTAERAGGSISVSSVFGKGTEFLVRLPVNRRGGVDL